MVLAQSVTFPFSFYVRPSLPSLCVPAPPLSLTRLRILYMCSLRRPLLVPSGMGRNVDTLPRHRKDMQVKSALRHSHCAVLNANVGPHLQQTLTAGQADRAGAVV